jgi:hypothetical protein
MGIIGNLLASASGDIGSWIDRNVFGGSGATGRRVGGALSPLATLIPFQQGGLVMQPNLNLVQRQPRAVKAMKKGGAVKKTVQKKK